MAAAPSRFSLLDHVKGTFTSPFYYLYVPYFSWLTSFGLFCLGMVVAGLFFTGHFGWRILPELIRGGDSGQLTANYPDNMKFSWEESQVQVTSQNNTFVVPYQTLMVSVALVTPVMLSVVTLLTGAIDTVLLYVLLQFNQVKLTFAQTLHLALHILLVSQLVTQLAVLLYGELPLPLFSLTFWLITLYLLFSWNRAAFSLTSSEE